jgi:hypothetical protein
MTSMEIRNFLIHFLCAKLSIFAINYFYLQSYRSICTWFTRFIHQTNDTHSKCLAHLQRNDCRFPRQVLQAAKTSRMIRAKRRCIELSFLICYVMSTTGTDNIDASNQRNLGNILNPIIEVPSEPVETSFVSCLQEKSFSVALLRCSYDLLVGAITSKMAEFDSCALNDSTLETLSLLSVGTVAEARVTVEQMCKSAVRNTLNGRKIFNFHRFSDMDYDFNKAFFDGGSSWNDGGASLQKPERWTWSHPDPFTYGASNAFRGNARRVHYTAHHFARSRPMSWPDEFENFNGCVANSAMCCWVDHDETRDAYKKNTDLCYVDHRATSSNHMKSGLGLFLGSENAFCHGFAWEDGSLDDLLKGNLLFLSEIYGNMHTQGLSKNVPGKNKGVITMSVWSMSVW